MSGKTKTMVRALILGAALILLTTGATKVGDKQEALQPGHHPKMQQEKQQWVYDWQNRIKPVPDKYVFQTKYLGGTQIVFDHKFHNQDLGIECIECHHVEGCFHCHREDVRDVDVQEAKVALHKTCFNCHEDMACVDCHKQ